MYYLQKDFEYMAHEIDKPVCFNIEFLWYSGEGRLINPQECYQCHGSH